MLIGALAPWVAVPAAAAPHPPNGSLSGDDHGSTPSLEAEKSRCQRIEYTGVIECADKAEGSVGAQRTVK